MGARFIGVDREQVFLMPPSVREWVPEGHLVWTVLDAVGELDLSAFYAVYRADGHGRPAYEPSMMVGLLAEPAWPGTTLTMTSLTVDEPSGAASSTRIVCVPGGSGRIIATHAAATKVVSCASTPRMFGDGRLAVICGETARYRSE